MTAFNGDPMIGQHPDTATPIYLTEQARDTAEIVDELHEGADRVTLGIMSEFHTWAVEQGKQAHELPTPVIEVTRPYDAADFGHVSTVGLAKVLPFVRPARRLAQATAGGSGYAAAP
jgi:hypothetical protein